jgi:hypothetical protein
MWSYLQGKGYTADNLTQYVGHGQSGLAIIPNFNFLQYIAKDSSRLWGSQDLTYISAYRVVQNGGGFGHSNPKTVFTPPLGISSVVDFLKLLTQPQLWVRVLEVGLGLLLVAAGLAKISSKASTIISATPVGRIIK